MKTYFELYENGIQLIFLKEHYIDTEVYAENMKDKIELQGTDEDEIFKGLNNYFRKLAEKQIRIAFDQAEKEVQDLHQRTKEGIQTAKLDGKQIGQRKGNKLTIKKAAPAKDIILKHSKSFNGTLSDIECIKLTRLSRNTYYKYKAELKEAEDPHIKNMFIRNLETLLNVEMTPGTLLPASSAENSCQFYSAPLRSLHRPGKLHTLMDG